MNAQELWNRYQKWLCPCKGLGISIDISRMPFDAAFFDQMSGPMAEAFDAMAQLEAGATANPDEGRMVGHYWLRAPEIAPQDTLGRDVQRTVERVVQFAADVHQKKITPPNEPRFTDLLLIGIGGSALGPQLVADALGAKRDKLRMHFLDNTDPDGFERTFAEIGTRLKRTLVVVISKSGGTKETRNGMVETQHLFGRRGLDFARHAVAVTGAGSALDKHAQENKWLAGFPMWDWVGGRTSVTSAVGLLPAALQGLNVEQLLEGAKEMDHLTRGRKVEKNPAALLALMWHLATGGQGRKQMVVLPYKDRLILLSRYLQQLVMESLGKGEDLDGNPVKQGLTVYGNKGSTDQHAFVQQLRDGLDDFFVNFLVVLRDRTPAAAKTAPDVEPGTHSGDYLSGFWQGTRKALYDSGRGSITITCDKIDAKTLGALIALYERAVGYYAELVNINAYHQPGVEAGKKAAAEVLEIQKQATDVLKRHGTPMSPEEIAEDLGRPSTAETIHHVLTHLAANKRVVKKSGGKFRCK